MVPLNEKTNQKIFDTMKIFDMQRYVGIPDFTPTHTLHVKFDINKDNTKEGDENTPPPPMPPVQEERKEPIEGKECGCGGMMTIEETTNPPVSVWWEGPAAHEDDSFALVQMDLDAPSKAKGWLLSPILHYMVISILLQLLLCTRILSDSLLYIDIVPTARTPWTNCLNRGVVVRNYLKPGPPPGSGPHRYVFVLCKQPRLYDIKEADTMRKLGKFKLNWPQLMQEYKLQPIAVDFFLCQNGNQFFYDSK